jgi:hypothetical protein
VGSVAGDAVVGTAGDVVSGAAGEVVGAEPGDVVRGVDAYGRGVAWVVLDRDAELWRDDGAVSTGVSADACG